MRVIIEGADGTGKSTVARHLAKKYGCDIVHMTKWGSRNIHDYVDKLHLNNVISDRSFLSEMVYKAASGLCPQISFTSLDDLMGEVIAKGWKIIILTAPQDVLKERLEKRADEDDEIIKNIGLIDNLYRIYGIHYDIPIIDTTCPFCMDDIEEVIEK